MRMRRVLAVSALAVDSRDKVLLIKRGHEPAKGLWSVPGGSVEPGETLVQALVREMVEEVALDVEVLEQVWNVSVALSEDADYDIHCFRVRVLGGTLCAGDDAEEARYVSFAEYGLLQTTPRLTELLALAGWPGLPGNSER
jgi:acetyl-CoA carboxylase carboxyl transferase subunit beta